MRIAGNFASMEKAGNFSDGDNYHSELPTSHVVPLLAISALTSWPSRIRRCSTLFSLLTTITQGPARRGLEAWYDTKVPSRSSGGALPGPRPKLKRGNAVCTLKTPPYLGLGTRDEPGY